MSELEGRLQAPRKRAGNTVSGLPRGESLGDGSAADERAADERYARAALTYLAEPADRVLGALVRVHGAARTLEAIRAGRDPSDDAVSLDGAASPGGPASLGGPIDVTRPWVRKAMERWRVRLTELPTPDQVAALARSGIRLVCPGDHEWPGQLADLGDEQPYALWLRGCADLRFSCLRSVAVVGSRAASAYGSYVAAEFAASVSARGWAVVSGGAFGVDASAHQGALAADGVTVAVLACGVDIPYPAAHTDLLEAIAAQGVIVSEWPPGRNVSRLRFLVRNRVIAALATGTLVVEAGQRSGAISTARHARDLGRRLMAVPGPITSDLSAGCHHIIREWQGTLVTSAADVVEYLSPVGAPPEFASPPTLVGTPELASPPTPAAVGGSGPPAGSPVRPASRRNAPPVVDRDDLDLESAQVLDAMPRRGGMATSRVAQRAGLPPMTAARRLGGLAAAGFVERCAEGWRLRRV
jgi:DNA processing protein